MGLKPPNICCFAMFGVIRLREGWKNILGAGASAESPQYYNLLTAQISNFFLKMFGKRIDGG
jgi:hypothetical protein